MRYRVGQQGQAVIAKEIRERLGIQPGWIAIQRLVDDHVEIRFVPPDHNRSLAGVLRPYIKTTMPTEEALNAACEDAWNMEALESGNR